MEILKPVGVIIRDRKYLVARDAEETFFKNVGGRVVAGESDIDALRRHLKTELGIMLDTEPDVLFDLAPTPAAGDPGDTVVLRGYEVSIEQPIEFTLGGNTAELAWVNSQTVSDYAVTPQIKDTIIPVLAELNLID